MSRPEGLALTQETEYKAAKWIDTGPDGRTLNSVAIPIFRQFRCTNAEREPTQVVDAW